jgi:MFS family permease
MDSDRIQGNPGLDSEVKETLSAGPDKIPAKADNGLGSWLSRNVFLFGLTSLLSDFCHEMATAILPQFMQMIGASAAALGFIEGVADALSSFVKLGAGYHSDRIGRRKTWTAIGYLLTAVAQPLFAFAFAWPLILIGRIVGWLGRGIRGPLRDAMLAESVAPGYRGKAFGFHRAGDTAGAVLGPLAAFGLLSLLASHPGPIEALGRWIPSLAGAAGGAFRIIFLLTYVPGLLSVLTILLVREKKHAPNHELRFFSALRSMPQDYRLFLLGVGLFGIADFAPTLMILRATTALKAQMGIIEASRIAALLYLLRNIVYAAVSYPIGSLSDRFVRSRFLAVGYAIAVITFIGFAVAVPSVWWFAVFFALAGVFIAWEDTVEGTAVRDYVGEELSGTAYGVLGIVNGIGDFISSFVVGMLWTMAGPAWGFGYAVLAGLIGALSMASIRSVKR